MTKADYTYEIIRIDGRQVLSIVDEDLGNTSVTNCIEDVVEEIADKEAALDLNTCHIVYRDSMGIWDGFDYKTKSFLYLGAHDKYQAREWILRKQLA
jgi:hypothetical protein